MTTQKRTSTHQGRVYREVRSKDQILFPKLAKNDHLCPEQSATNQIQTQNLKEIVPYPAINLTSRENQSQISKNANLQERVCCQTIQAPETLLYKGQMAHLRNWARLPLDS